MLTPPDLNVLVVDDDPPVLDTFERILDEGFTVHKCPDAREALATLSREWIDVVVLDVGLPDMDGMTLLGLIRRQHPALPVVMMTGGGRLADAVESMRQGAVDYIVKPGEPAIWRSRIRQAGELKRLREENARLRERGRVSPSDLLLESRTLPMQHLLSRLKQVAATDATVLLTGPTGAGKTALARAIHDLSPRRARPFVSLNCAAVPPALVPAELFGQQEGAFPGAARNPGLFEVADGGTVLLDEIGALPWAQQHTLLEVLERGVVRPIGVHRELPVDVRILFTTLRDLEADVAEGRFREDLYYRLKVIELRLPALDERRDDVPALAQHLLRVLDGEDRSFSAECLLALQERAWPGAVRELRNVIEAAVVFAGDAPRIQLSHLPSGPPSAAAKGEPLLVDPSLPYREAQDEARLACRRAYLEAVVARFETVAASARHAGLDRANFRRELRRFAPHLMKG